MIELLICSISCYVWSLGEVWSCWQSWKVGGTCKFSWEMNSSLNLYPRRPESKGVVILTSQFVIGFAEHNLAWLSPFAGLSDLHGNLQLTHELLSIQRGQYLRGERQSWVITTEGPLEVEPMSDKLKQTYSKNSKGDTTKLQQRFSCTARHNF